MNDQISVKALLSRVFNKHVLHITTFYSADPSGDRIRGIDMGGGIKRYIPPRNYADVIFLVLDARPVTGLLISENVDR